MWRLHCVVGKGNVLKSLFRILLEYNWYINESFLGWQSGGKKQGARDYPGYLFILVKKGKNLRSRRTKK